MANNQKKYASLTTLQNLVGNIKSLFATKTDMNTELAKKADAGHTHTIANVTNLQPSLDSKAPTSRTINGKPLSADITLSASDVGAAPTSHSHDDRYYTETEIDTKLSTVNASIDDIKSGEIVVKEAEHADIADTATSANYATSADSATSATKATQDGNGKVISSTYETKSDASAKLTEAKTYADNAANAVKDDLLNGAGTAYDTLKELGDLIDDNKDAIDALETVASGKANAVHTHKVSDISDLTVSATELNYIDGVTSNVQAQLDSLSSDLESHTHSASDITSGTMDAARLPKASGTAAGIMSTGTQTIAGTKTFTGQIKPAGVLTSGHITASADSTYSIGSTTSAFNNAYINSLFINPERVNGSSIFGGSFEVEKAGTDTQVGIAKLKIGNPTKEGTAGNARGFIQIYNENNGSVTLQTDHSDDYAFRVNLPRTTGRLMTNNEVYTIEDHTKTLIYDSGAITSKVHSISNIEVYGYTHFLVAVACVNDGSNISKSGSAIFKSNDGTTYQFPVWTNMFSTSANVISAGMAQFEVIDGYIMCPFASRNIRTSNFFSDTEGGTADNLTSTGSGIMKCTKAVKYLTISSLDQDASCYFGVGSRVMVWGWNA